MTFGEALAAAVSTLTIRYMPGDDSSHATVALLADGRPIGGDDLPFAVPPLWQYGGAHLRIGFDEGLPVVDDYRVPFRWVGDLAVTVDVGTSSPAAPAEALKAATVGD